jgi:hypothetical protein
MTSLRDIIRLLKNEEVCKGNTDLYISIAKGKYELPKTRWGRIKKKYLKNK